MSHTIAILNQKGGVGKTTTAINLAAYLAKSGKNVLIIDADPQGNATSGLGLDKNNLASSTYEVLLGNAAAREAILETTTIGVNVLPANANLAAAETELANETDRETRLQKNMTQLDYDFIIIDCPPALGLLTVNALVAAHWLLVPVQAEYYAMEGLGQLLSVFQRVKQSFNPRLELLGMVVTMYDKRTSLSDQVVDELKQHFSSSVFETVVPRNVRLAEAPSHGRPISEHDKWSKGARAYKQLTREVLKRVG